MIDMWKVPGIVLAVTFLLAASYANLPRFKFWADNVKESIYRFFEDPRRCSTVPQFLLDARHPWIVKNRRLLERLPNAEEYLCIIQEGFELKRLVGKNNLEIPEDLFHRLEIDNNRYGIDRPGWANAEARLLEMQRCPRALLEVERLHVNVCVDEPSLYMPKFIEPSNPGARLISLFGDVLESMPNLETLQWRIPARQTADFEEAFSKRELQLTSVRTLQPAQCNEYLVKMCPNVESIVTHGGPWKGAWDRDKNSPIHRLLRSATHATALKRFSLQCYSDDWTPDLARDVLQYMPQIQSIGIGGGLSNDNGWDEDSNKTLEDFLQVLGQFQRITHVGLPSSSELHVGFDGGPECGNAYMGKNGYLLSRRVLRRNAEATERAGVVVSEVLPHLLSFTIGGWKPKLVILDGKIVKIEWPWTGRLEDWIVEQIPEKTLGT